MNSKSEVYKNDLISVIMPAYNSSRYISDSIKSVLKQTYKQWELIIYDDASTDDTAEIIEEFTKNSSQINLIRGQINQGVAYARNTAVQNAKGRYIAFLDSDDLWAENKLEIQLTFMKKNKCSLSYCEYVFIDQSGSEISRNKSKIKNTADYPSLLKNNFIGMLTVCIDRISTGDIKFSLERHEDLILWLNLIKKRHKLMGINKSLAKYRVYNKSLSGNKIKAALWRWRVYRKAEKLNIFSSIWYMMCYMINSLMKRI